MAADLTVAGTSYLQALSAVLTEANLYAYEFGMTAVGRPESSSTRGGNLVLQGREEALATRVVSAG